MEEGRFSPKRHWVSLDKRQECLALFQEGNGYKSTATMTEHGHYDRAEQVHGQGLQAAVRPGR